MDINEIQRCKVENEYLYRLRSKNAKSEPAFGGPLIT